MDSEFKEKWVAALRSGDYEQGARALRSQKKHFCCLGVACDLIDSTAWESLPGDRLHYWKGWRAALPERTAQAIDLDENAQGTLIELNDTGSSFTEIADWIEKNL